MKHRITAMVLVLCMILAMPLTAHAGGAASGSCGDSAQWSFDDATGTLTINGTGPIDDYVGNEGMANRPWLHLCDQVRHIVIGDGITRIGESAFSSFSELQQITFSDTVTEIGNYAFTFAGKLESLNLPPRLTSLGQQAFWCCSGLTSVELPGTMTFIDACVFEECTGLTKAVIRSDPATPSLVIGNSIFRGCTALETIEVDEDHFGLKSIDDVLYTYDDFGLTLQQYPLGRTVPALIIPDGTILINQFALERAQHLTSVTIPASMESIWTMAFSCCPKLREMTFLGSAPALHEDIWFFNELTVYYPIGDPTWTADVMLDYGGTVTWAVKDPGNPFRDVPASSYYYEPVLWAVEKGITAGMTPTTFKPDGECTRAQVVTFLWRAAGCPKPKNTTHSFTDVVEGAFYYDAMLWAVEKGITQGTTKTTFGPGKPCDRGTVVTFLHRAENCPEPTSTEHPFTDVDEDRFYYTAMLWAVEKGITSGTGKTTFAPDRICTRGQVVTFLHRTYVN